MHAGGNGSHDVYAGADFVPLLRKKPIIVWRDFDGTITEGHHPPTPRALQACDAIAKFEQEQELTTGNITARPLSFTMNAAHYDASVLRGFDQPPPKWFERNGVFLDYRETGDWCQDPFFTGCVNHHITGSLGGGIGVRHGNAYLIDREYERLLIYDHVEDAKRATLASEFEGGPYAHGAAALKQELGPVPWRIAMFEFLLQYFPEAFEFMPAIEHIERYREGKANAAPQIARLQLVGQGSAALRIFQALLTTINRERYRGNRLACRIVYTSEDKVDPVNPENSTYTLYLMPKHGVKKQLFNWPLRRMAKAAGWSVQDVLMFYAGDTATDLLTALWGGLNGRVIALVVSRARIAQALRERWQYYGLQYLGNLWANPAKGRMEDRLQPTAHKGVYRVYHKVSRECNYLVMGDERYPNETAPGSVYCFLNEYVPRTPHWGLGRRYALPFPHVSL